MMKYLVVFETDGEWNYFQVNQTTNPPSGYEDWRSGRDWGEVEKYCLFDTLDDAIKQAMLSGGTSGVSMVCDSEDRETPIVLVYDGIVFSPRQSRGE